MLAPASKASCADSTCSATVIGTAGLSDFLGSEPVIATQMMQGFSVMSSNASFDVRRRQPDGVLELCSYCELKFSMRT